MHRIRNNHKHLSYVGGVFIQWWQGARKSTPGSFYGQRTTRTMMDRPQLPTLPLPISAAPAPSFLQDQEPALKSSQTRTSCPLHSPELTLLTLRTFNYRVAHTKTMKPSSFFRIIEAFTLTADTGNKFFRFLTSLSERPWSCSNSQSARTHLVFRLLNQGRKSYMLHLTERNFCLAKASFLLISRISWNDALVLKPKSGQKTKALLS